MHSHQKTYHQTVDYRKLFPELPPLYLTDDQLWELNCLMIEDHQNCQDSESITNGEATFGQFLAHDMTFENTSTFQKSYHQQPLDNVRSIRLDLDSVYGLKSETFYYQRRRPSKLLLTHMQDGGYKWWDVPRNEEDTAIIPDPRDDESIIVSRLHVLFMQFHNCYIDSFLRDLPFPEQYREARLRVTWFYHWLIVHHYVYKMIDPQIADDILANGAKYYTDPCFLPLEFSGAALRVGHSQSRGVSQLNEYTHAGIFDLGSFDRANVFVDWAYLFDCGDGKVEFAKKIDTKIARAFQELPFIEAEGMGRNRSLVFRNLKRGVVYGLPSGESIAKRMCVEPLLIPETQRLCLSGTPLWFYILKEAELLHAGEHLGPVGSRIFGEVFLSLLTQDPNSYLLQHPKWEPNGLGNDTGVFGFKELINFIED